MTSSNDTDTQSDTEVGEDVGTQANAFVEGPFRAKDGTEWNRIPPKATKVGLHNIVRGPVGISRNTGDLESPFGISLHGIFPVLNVCQ